MKENLLATIEGFSSPACRLTYDEPYRNKHGIRGRTIVAWHAGQFHKLSISNCQKILPTLEDIIRCLRAVEEMDPHLWGFYESRKFEPGYYATFRSTLSFDGNDHWYMLGRSSDWKTILRMQKCSGISDELKDVIEYLVARKITLRK